MRFSLTNRHNLCIYLAATILLNHSLEAQDAAPLVRRPSNITVKTGEKPKTQNQDGVDGIGEKVEDPKVETDPSLVIVALVNSHTITRAQLDRRVQARTKINPSLLKTPTSTSTIKDLVGTEIVEVEGIQDFQDRTVRNAVIEEESKIIEEWQEQMMLADEARRQQFLVTNQELQLRLDELEKEFSLNEKRVDNLLEAFGMTREELESSIYEALLIEKLLNRFMELNYTEADFFTSYEANPGAYRVAPQKRIAHFSISLLGNETPTVIRKFKDQAEEIRSRLKNGEAPEKIMEETNDFESGNFGSVLNWSTEKTVQNRSREDFYLPDVVVSELQNLKKNEISKVLTNSFTSGGQEIIESFHVINVLEEIPATGETFESALPKMKKIAQVNAREQVLQLLKEAKTHKRIVRMSGIHPSKLPTPESLRANVAPISLKLASASVPKKSPEKSSTASN